MWYFAKIPLGLGLWFSDGYPISHLRGGDGLSSRLIAADLGFLDITEFRLHNSTILDLNGGQILTNYSNIRFNNAQDKPLLLYLEVDIQNTKFRVGVLDADDESRIECVNDANIYKKTHALRTCVPGSFKALPAIDRKDVDFLDEMIQANYVPYRNIPEAPGKSGGRIRQLGKQMFPFTPYSFHLAMAIYDWTTASFVRMVLFKIYQYTSVKSDPEPFPLDIASIARAIYESDWHPYTANNTDYMNSFMMKPASSLREVQDQLSKVVKPLYHLSEVENRLLTAAVQSLPRTPVFKQHQLFSGQVDIRQLGINGFGIEFFESPLNSGPIGTPLTDDFETVISTYVSVGKTVTTKMPWSFTDNIENAMHYSNGILLTVLSPSTAVWESAHYITALSTDPAKTEYIFPAKTGFQVISIRKVKFKGRTVVSIELLPTAFDSQHLPPTWQESNTNSNDRQNLDEYKSSENLNKAEPAKQIILY